MIAISATLLAVPGERRKGYLVLAASTGVIACLLRPILLPMVVVLPVLFSTASRITGRRVAARSVVALLLLLVLPLLLYAADRASRPVILSWWRLEGLQYLESPGCFFRRTLRKTCQFQTPLTEMQVLAAREQAEAAGRVLRTPLNSQGERSFTSAAAGYFDIYARTYDELLYGEIAKLQLPGQSS